MGLSLLGLTSSCGDSPSSTSSTAGAGEETSTPALSSKEIERGIRDLVTAVTPLPPEATVGAQSEWFPTRRSTLKRMRAMGPEFGRAALAEYFARAEDLDDIRAGLLDVAAHAAPADTVEHLAELITSYGPQLKLRRTATELLQLVDPQRAYDVLLPIVTSSDRGRTYPPDDIMLEAWAQAGRTLKLDRSSTLAQIALDYGQSQEARHTAASTLGNIVETDDREIAKNALRTLLIESSGNNYLRRKSAQSLRSILTKEELCAILEESISKEADVNFGLFLNDMIEGECR